VTETEARAGKLSSALSAARSEAVAGFEETVAAELRGLGMGDGEFQAELSFREPGINGSDTVSFLVRPNPGLPFAPVAETASGGELSRIALALRAVAHAAAGEPTVVFDEIDAGIGGRTAHAVADALARLAERAQVVTITHLPQIASAAAAHFRVEKVLGDPTHTRIERLSDAERREELERMLGGAEFLSAVRRAG
jgi:DNA repair protein RecN (Recombination protein N)